MKKLSVELIGEAKCGFGVDYDLALMRHFVLLSTGVSKNDKSRYFLWVLGSRENHIN